MNWAQLAHYTAIVMGVTFVVAAGIYLAIWFRLFNF
jgi:hypothetical protein